VQRDPCGRTNLMRDDKTREALGDLVSAHPEKRFLLSLPANHEEAIHLGEIGSQPLDVFRWTLEGRLARRRDREGRKPTGLGLFLRHRDRHVSVNQTTLLDHVSGCQVFHPLVDPEPVGRTVVSVPRSGGNSGWTSGVEIPVT
jgi:hypothetical protein